MSTGTRSAPRAPSTNRPPVSRAVARTVGGMALVAGLAVVLALFMGGGRRVPTFPGLPDPGPITGWALPLTTTLATLAGTLTVGLLLVAAMFLPSRKESLGSVALRCVVGATAAAGTWAVFVLLEALFTLSDLLGAPLPQVLDPTVITSYLTQIVQGRALLVQFIGALLLTLVCWTLTTTSTTAIALVGAVAVVLPPTLTGHSGASDRHEIAVSSLMLHVGSISLWVGGLAALCIVAAFDTRPLRGAVPRYSMLAIWVYVITVGSGIANAWIRLASPTQLFTTGYGQLVVLKTTLAAVLGWFGWWHRRRTMPELAGPRRATAVVRLAGVEVLVMAAAIGLGVGLSRTAPPVNDAIDLSGANPARIVLGYDLPPIPNTTRLLLTQVRIDALWVAVVVLLAALYIAGVRTLSRRNDRWPVGRSTAWGFGLFLLLWSTNGGVSTYSHVLFSAHMVQHMMLSMIVPILLVLGAPGTLALRSLPAHHEDPGPREWLVRFLNSRYVHFFTNPIVATIIFVTGFYGLYFTPLFPTLMAGHWGHLFMQVHFLLAGYLFVWTLIGIDPGPRRPPYPVRILVLLGAMSIHAFFNIAILQ
jgi:cytochrome c oxidase assembly factor CtaG/putative copper export protein